MSNIDKETLKKAQQIMLEILIEVDKICKKYNIKYWLDSGTLLGAVRHKCFIPWDDDLDISMTLEDFEKFCKIAPKELSKNLFLQTKETDSVFPYDIAKIRSNKGILIEKHELGKKVEYNQGIFIDIIPVIRIKNNFFIKFYYKFIFLLIKLFSYKYFNNYKVRSKLINFIDRFNSVKGKKIIRSGKFPELKFELEADLIFPLKKIKFCNKEFYAPNNVDLYLRTLYGNDYMKLPPKEKRVTHAYSIKIK